MGHDKKPAEQLNGPLGDPSPGHGKHPDKSDDPEWAAGLRQLYDAVVDEELPDTFKDLLAQLDAQPSADNAADPADGSAQ